MANEQKSYTNLPNSGWMPCGAPLSAMRAPSHSTSKALETLLVLVRNRDRVLTKDELMKALWPDSFVEEVNLAQNVSAVRKALGEAAGENRYIATIPGRGYRFVGQVRDESEVERRTGAGAKGARAGGAD